MKKIKSFKTRFGLCSPLTPISKNLYSKSPGKNNIMDDNMQK